MAGKFFSRCNINALFTFKQYCKVNGLKNNEDTNYVSEQIRFLATKYSVSEKAMYVRLRQLNYIDYLEFYEI